MYKYVHLLVKYATPIYSDKKFAIIEIISFNNLVDVLDYRNDDNEMPAVIGEKRDDVYYICIDKHNPNNIKCRLVSGEQINFDTIVNKFNSYSKYYSIEHIFDIDLNETDASLFSDLQRSVEILPYKKLTFYNSDNTSR